MAKRSELRTIDLEDDTCENIPKTLHLVFIRITVENKLKKQELIDEIGDTVLTYDEQYLKDFFNGYEDDVIEYAYILHENDKNEKGEVEQAHYHICMRKTNSTNFKFPTLKHAFPVGKIERGRTWEYMLQYLLHKNSPEKTQHTIEEIVTNIDGGTLDLYLKSTPSVKSKNALEYQLDKLINDINDDKLLQYQFNEALANNTLYRRLYAKYERKINDAFNAQKIALYEKNKKNRKLKVIYIDGDGGCGKTALGIALCESKGWSYFISSDENDAMEGYASQYCLILDDLRDTAFSYSSFLRLINTYTGNTVKSRYRNKAFTGEVVIIPSFCPLCEFYKDDPKLDKKRTHVADKDYYDSDPLVQLHRRIKTLIHVDKDSFYIYSHKEDGSDVLKAVIPNPAYLLKPEEDTDDFDIDDFVGAREFFAQKLISSNKISAEDDELYKMYEAEKDASELGILFNINERPISFEAYRDYHIAKRLAGGTLYNSQGEEITLETFQYQQPDKKEE